jgi:hypothetical protein
MYFTPYVTLANTNNSVDPLGFLQPGAALADLLFRQFTVLSQHPAYHGFLCFALNHLKEPRPGYGKSQATRIRDMEIFWGVLSLRLGGESILNVTKYRRLPDTGVTLAKAREKRFQLYDRLNYGTLGHYTGPSLRWGLLNEQDRSLTPLGRELAEAWGARGKIPFAPLLKEWLDGNTVLDSRLDELGPYSVSAEPSKTEQEVWRRIIENTCQEEPISGVLWENPITLETLELAETEKTYHSFFPSVAEHYSGHPALRQRLYLCQHFEAICALVQFVFEWAYLRKSRHENAVPKAFPKETVLLALQESIEKFHSFSLIGKLRWNLPERLIICSSYSTLEDSIIQHHCGHQRRKGAAAFMDTEKILLSGRVDEGRIAALAEKLDGSPEQITRAASWTYRRGWYFWNAQLWLRHAGMIA